MDLKNLTELELYFANHFDTVLFPVLADIYQSKGQYDRAKRVCEIGLDHHPNSLDGYYILSQAEMGLGNLSAAEKWMKKVLKQDPSHKSAASGLPMVQEQLEKRGMGDLFKHDHGKYISIILHTIPTCNISSLIDQSTTNSLLLREGTI